MAGNWQSPTKPWDQCSEKRQAQLAAVWGAGNLRWKLDPSQQRIYDDIYASHGKVKSSAERLFCMDVSRQSGKDFIMSIIAIECCLRNRRPLRIPYGAPTKDTVHELLVPTMETIFQDCPPDLLPNEIRRGTFRSNAKELNWTWGARIVLVGVDLHPDWLRGPATFAFFLTEPGFIDNLDDLMGSVLLPMMLTVQQGFGVLGSTPPVTPGHPWSTKYIPDAKTRGMYAKRVIDDCPRFSQEQIDGFIKELGGRKSTRVRRELYCDHIIESSLAVVPEFADLRETVVTTAGFDKPPMYRDCYVSIDPGFSHATGGVFGYYDFQTDLFMVEGDLDKQGMNSREVSRAIKAREWQLWGKPPVKPSTMTDEAWVDELEAIRREFYLDLKPPDKVVLSARDGDIKPAPLRRVSDTDSRLIADMSTEHGLLFAPTDKPELTVMLNNLRISLGKYRIHPRCVALIMHLEQATWNRSRTKMAESAGGGHFDCIPAMTYLNLSISWGRNPNPPMTHSKTTHFTAGHDRPMTQSGQAASSLFARKRRRR